LYEETLGQKTDDGTPLPEVLVKQGILPGIKVDKGTTALPNADGDLITQGLDGLGERLKEYKAKGARFAKWREVYGITDRNPTRLTFSNARALKDPPMKLWAGRAENVSAAQRAFHQRLKMNSLARDGKYRAELEKAA